MKFFFAVIYLVFMSSVKRIIFCYDSRYFHIPFLLLICIFLLILIL